MAILFCAVHSVHYRLPNCTAQRRRNDDEYLMSALLESWVLLLLHPGERQLTNCKLRGKNGATAVIARVVPEIEDTVDANGRLLDQQPTYDRIINAEVHLQLGDNYHNTRGRDYLSFFPHFWCLFWCSNFELHFRTYLGVDFGSLNNFLKILNIVPK
jgi:hypothetical protein